MNKKSKFRTPILLLIFNRPNLTKKVFEKIRQIRPLKLFIAADGPRTISEKLICDKTRKTVIANIDWDCDVQTLFHPVNLGCGIAVSSAIDWFFTYVDQGIILEDDCLPNSSFFCFSQEMLEKYRHNPKVMHISGCNFSPSSNKDYSYHFSLYPSIWGWATWRRAWNQYKFLPKSFISYNKIQNKKEFLLRKIQFLTLNKGLVDTWDYQWLFSIIKENGLTIRPSKNLVKNIGTIGTHIKKIDIRFNSELQKMLFPLKHPKAIKRNVAEDMKYRNLFLHKSYFDLFKQLLYLKLK